MSHREAPRRLAGCPRSPNCVSTDATADRHHLAPFRLRAAPADAWRAVREAVASLPRTTVVTATDEYLHAECRSRIWRFVDDLEIVLRTSERALAVRSASRVGYSDLGVNRRRAERLRAELRARGVVT